MKKVLVFSICLLMITGLFVSCKHDSSDIIEIPDPHKDWTALTFDVTTLEGNYYLTEDVTVYANIVVDYEKEATLCLNGYMLNLNGHHIVNNGKLTIDDCNDSNSVHKYTETSTGLWEFSEEGTKTVVGGVITGGKGDIPGNSGTSITYGGAILNNLNGTLIIKDGYIAGNCVVPNQSQGGGSTPTPTPTPTPQPSPVTLNVSYSGGAIANFGSLRILGGNICGNTASHKGGAIANCGFMTFDNGEIAYNKADVAAGAVYSTHKYQELVDDTVFFIMNNGSIKNCSVVKTGTDGGLGGAVVIGKKTSMIMNDGCISDCTSQNGGAVYIENNSTFTMNDGLIDSCVATKCGGAVSLNDSEGSWFKMNDGTISNCSASFGGAIVNTNGTFFMNGNSTISGCSVSKLDEDCAGYIFGGALFNTNTVVINGGTFTENSAEKGGAIHNADNINVKVDGYSVKGNITINNATFTKNTATKEGGSAIQNSENCSIKFGNVSITENVNADSHKTGAVFTKGKISFKENALVTIKDNTYDLATGSDSTVVVLEGALKTGSSIGIYGLKKASGVYTYEDVETCVVENIVAYYPTWTNQVFFTDIADCSLYLGSGNNYLWFKGPSTPE